MLYFHYVITVYDGKSHQPIGRNGGVQQVANGTTPMQSHTQLVEQFGARLPTLPGVTEGAYFIISPYNFMAMDDTESRPVGAPAPISEHQQEAMREWQRVAEEHDSITPKASFEESQPGDFYFDAMGEVQYHAHGMDKPEPCPRCGTVSSRPDGEHYCRIGSNEQHEGNADEFFREQHLLKPSGPVPDCDTAKSPPEMMKCDQCWHEMEVWEWIDHDGECPACNTSHPERTAGG